MNDYSNLAFARNSKYFLHLLKVAFYSWTFIGMASCFVGLFRFRWSYFSDGDCSNSCSYHLSNHWSYCENCFDVCFDFCTYYLAHWRLIFACYHSTFRSKSLAFDYYENACCSCFGYSSEVADYSCWIVDSAYFLASCLA